MIETCVVDASVGMKTFLSEEYSAEVRMLFKSKAILLAPDLFHIECTNILWKRVSRDSYPRQSAIQNILDLYAFKLPTLPTAGLMARALELAFTYKVTPYDASYLALADLHNVPLITADMPLHKALTGRHIQVLTIPEYLAQGI